MKIVDTSGIGKAYPAKRKTGTGAAGDFSSLMGEEEPVSANNPLASLSPVASLAGLLAVQEAETNIESIKRGIEQGNELLDSLEQLRFGLLEGRIAATTTKRLADQLREEKAIVDDPELLAILDEIDTRAQVELAKLEAAKLIS